jgi:ABC-type glycerol-3-phosphate transport system permease component
VSGALPGPDGTTATGAATTTALGRLAVARTAPTQPTAGRWKRRAAYVILISYALLMFVPFGWSVITSFKTLPDSLHMSLPDPWTLQAWDYALTKLRPNVITLFTNSLVIAGVVTISTSRWVASPATPSRDFDSRCQGFSSCSSWRR